MANFDEYVEPSSYEEIGLRELLASSKQEMRMEDITLMEVRQNRPKSVKGIGVHARRMSKVGDVIGEGNFGQVKKALVKTSSPMVNAHGEVAVKTISPLATSEAKSSFLQEIVIMRQFEHVNVVRLLGHVVQGNNLILVMELCDIALDETLKKNGHMTPLGPRMRYCMDSAKGMGYLQKRNFVHRDIAARNILLQKGSCKIGDFGMSTPLATGGDYYKSSGGKVPLRWCSLETIKFRRFSLKTDIWAFGVLIHEVFSNAGLPYPAIRNRDLPDKLESGYRLPPVGMCPLKVYVLMLKCWDEDPSRRPSAETIEQEIFECARFSKDERAVDAYVDAVAANTAVEANSAPLGDEDAYEYAPPPIPPPRTSVNRLSTSSVNSSVGESIVIGGDDAFDLEALVAAAMVAQDGQEEVLDGAPPAIPSRNSRNVDRPRAATGLPPQRNSASASAAPAPRPRGISSTEGMSRPGRRYLPPRMEVDQHRRNWLCPSPISRDAAEQGLRMLEVKGLGIPGSWFIRKRKDNANQFVISLIVRTKMYKHYTLTMSSSGDFYLADRRLVGCDSLEKCVKLLSAEIEDLKWHFPLRNCPGPALLAKLSLVDVPKRSS